jgi:tetratricopeptide (TPR) repeat protein
MVMEYLEGKTLSDFIKDSGLVPVERAIAMFTQALDGLAAAHEKGVIHRDVKPSNIFLTSDAHGDVVKILDFGLAKLMDPEEGQGNLTQTGETMGTPDYMSPEQCQGQPLDVRSDLYSFGYVMYEVLTGKQAVSGKNAFESMHAHIYDMPQPMNVANPQAKIPEAVEAVIFKALSKKPAERYQSALELKAALEEASQRADKLPPLVRKGLNWMHSRRRRSPRIVGGHFSAAQVMVPGLVAIVLLAAAAKYVDAVMHAGGSHNSNVVEVNPAEAWKTYFTAGANAFNEGDFKTARKYFELADKQALKLGEQSDQYTSTLSKLKDVYERLGEKHLAAAAKQRITSIENRYYWKQLGTIEGNNEKILAYTEELVKDPDNKKVASDLASVLNNQGRLFVKDCKYDKAKNIFDRAEAIERKLLGTAHPEYAKTLNNMSWYYFQLGNKEKAIALSEQALAIREKACGPNDPLTARSCQTVADYYMRTGDLKRAEQLLKRSCDIYAKSPEHGPRSEDYSWSLNNLGNVLMFQNRFDEAEKTLRTALDIRREIGGQNGVDAGRTLCNLGLLDMRRSRWPSAISQLKQSLTIFESELGPESRDAATTAMTLGEAYVGAGDAANGEKYLTRALNTLLSLEPRGADTVTAFQDLMYLYNKQGNLEAARRLTERVSNAQK